MEKLQNVIKIRNFILLFDMSLSQTNNEERV